MFFFASEQELAMVKEEFKHSEDYERYLLVFGFGNKDENGEVTTIESAKNLDTNDILESLNEQIEYYRKNDIYGSYLNNESKIVIDVYHRDEEDFVTMIG